MAIRPIPFHQRFLPAVLLLLLFLFPVAAHGMETKFFPQHVLFPKFLADATAQQMSFSKDLRTRRILGSIGGPVRIVQFTQNTVTVQVGIGASVKATFIKTTSVLQAVTADFFVDLPIECRVTDHLSFRTGWGHHSGHFADDGIEVLKLSSVNYAKDYIPLLCAYNVGALNGFIYGGARLDYYTIPETGKHWILQWGAEAGNFTIFDGLRLYGTFDVKARSEAAWGTTQSYQIGLKFLEHQLNTIRVAYTYRTGIADEGQFYKQRSELSLLGVYLDF